MVEKEKLNMKIKPGTPFSKGLSEITFVSDVSYGDIESIWVDEYGNYFGLFFTSGLRAITYRLAKKALEYIVV